MIGFEQREVPHLISDTLASYLQYDTTYMIMVMRMVVVVVMRMVEVKVVIDSSDVEIFLSFNQSINQSINLTINQSCNNP